MNKDLYQNLDLNLLRTFLILSQELNMRKTSERLRVSQPAISQALVKLRHHFDDELFVKVPRGVRPTPFAESLAKSIEPHLLGLAEVLNQSAEFDPANLEQTLKIALSPVMMSGGAGILFKRIRESAPKANIELVGWNTATLAELENGAVLLGVHYDIGTSKTLFTEPLVKVRGVVFVRQDHPLNKAKVELEDLEDLEIASLIIPDWNEDYIMVAEAMKRRNLKYRVGFRSEFVTALADVVQSSDMYMGHTNLFPADHCPQLRAMTICSADQPYEIEAFSYCHVRNRHNPVKKWLHTLVSEVLTEQMDKFDKQYLSPR
ncbi:LysR family transcriptional regulator [Aliagarivorans taiwanensis]|uniref:LysR family transcriptional regulator n=1 Tax=Aliagarivorans taiwanensis TaxID=561966 RepID=UPI00041E8A65|nr:LysR family transcriptional regulator [Aliagarivorans taiwanensis]